MEVIFVFVVAFVVFVAFGSEFSEQIGGNVDAYCAAVGTGGSLMGAIDGGAAGWHE